MMYLAEDVRFGRTEPFGLACFQGKLVRPLPQSSILVGLPAFESGSMVFQTIALPPKLKTHVWRRDRDSNPEAFLGRDGLANRWLTIGLSLHIWRKVSDSDGRAIDMAGGFRNRWVRPLPQSSVLSPQPLHYVVQLPIIVPSEVVLIMSGLLYGAMLIRLEYAVFGADVGLAEPDVAASAAGPISSRVDEYVRLGIGDLRELPQLLLLVSVRLVPSLVVGHTDLSHRPLYK